MSEPEPQAEQPVGVSDRTAVPASEAAGEPVAANEPGADGPAELGETVLDKAGPTEPTLAGLGLGGPDHHETNDGQTNDGETNDSETNEGENGSPAKVWRSRRLRLVLGGVLAIVVAGAAGGGVAGFQIITQKDATLNPPDQVGTLRRDNGAEAQSTAEYLRDALSAEVDLDKAVGAVYTDTARTDRNVLFFGGTNLLWKPERDLDTAFALITDKAGAVTGLHGVQAGHFGGTMQCGSTASSDGDIAVCGWADHGSVALAMFPSWTPADAAPVFLAIRNATQSRS